MSVLSDSRPASEKLPPILELRPYQQRWVDDQSRFKGAVKSARTGFSFATAAEAVLDCIEHPGTTWTVLSHSKAGSNEFVEEGAGKICRAIQAAAEVYSEPFADELGTTDIQVQKIRFPNGSRIIALPANPRTARGYPGNTILDEFAHHENSYGVWAAVSRQIALGHKMRILSTPNGEQGKFYDLAHSFGFDAGAAPPQNPAQIGAWSWHWIDVHMAIAEGCPINLQETRELYKGDDDTFAQEFLCAFLKAVGAYLPLELIARAEDDGAWMQLPAQWKRQGRLVCGIDVARDGDRTRLVLGEEIGDVVWTRHIETLHNVPFFDHMHPEKTQAALLLPWVQMADRTAIDATGLGLGLFEYLSSKVPGRVMGVNFGGSVKVEKPGAQSVGAESVKIKVDMAVRLKKFFEQSKLRIPHDLQIRQELQSIKREYSGGAITFDAPRIEVDTPVGGGKRKKVFAHADAFWAYAMLLLAASGAPISTEFRAPTGSSLASQISSGVRLGGHSQASLAARGF